MLMTVINVVKGGPSAYLLNMRVTKEQAAQNRREILDVAERLFQERGFGGVAVADLMKEAGFTHGGFYNHFASKDALAAETCATAFARASEEMAEALADPRGKTLKDLVARYASEAHRDGPAAGCTMAALAGDAARQSAEVQAPFAEGLDRMIALLADHLLRAQPGLTKAAARERAIELWSELVGALVLSRAVSRASPDLSDEILAAVRRRAPRAGG